MFAEFNNSRHTSTAYERTPLHIDTSNLKKVSIECDSPLMLTKNNARKNNGLLRDDSCLKFKMKENILTGRTD
jgi:hypothetical protein